MTFFLDRTRSSDVIVQAIEQNAAEFLVLLGVAGGGEERNDEALRWVIGGSPIDYHNCVVYTNLTAETVDTAIMHVIERLGAYNLPGTWHAGPSIRPPDIDTHLRAHGFSGGEEEPGMAADLHALHEELRVPEGLEIRRVRDQAGLIDWMQTLAVDFGEGEHEANWVGSVYRRLGLGDNTPLRHYVGYLGEKPVATASMFFGAGVAGIYFVATIPEARRQGIGAAITLAALQEARALGYNIGVLGASQAGYSVYQRLGFKEYCTIRIYTWNPPTQK